MNEDYFRDNFNTKLSPEDEDAFNAWVKILSEKTGRDRSMDVMDYDLRGLWQKEHPAPLDDGHFVDTYKKPNHPSFSVESMYHGTPSEAFGGNWEGGVWGPNYFKPSLKMLNSTHDAKSMQEYFKRTEPGYKLILK